MTRLVLATIGAGVLAWQTGASAQTGAGGAGGAGGGGGGGNADHAFLAYQAQMAAAEKSVRLGEPRELRRWLEATDPALRGWEWEHLRAVADTTSRRVKTPQKPVRIAASPSGDRLACVEGSKVRVLAWPSLEERAVVEGHGDAVYRAEFSPDGQRLITVSRDVTARTWDLATGKEIARMAMANPAVAAVAFGPRGDVGATCAWERDAEGVHGVVWVWDPASGEVRHRKRAGVKPLSALRFTRDGSRIVVGSWDGLVHVLDAEATEVRRLKLPDEGVYNAVNDVAVSPDGRLVAAAAKDRTTRVFEIETGSLVATLRGHGGYVEGVEFSADGRMLITASADATAALWSAGDWSRVKVLRGAADTVRGATWAGGGPGGGAGGGGDVIACTLDGELLVWDAGVSDSGAVEIRTGHKGVYSAALSPAGDVVAAACFDGRVRLYDPRTGALAREWHAHPGSTCHAAAFSADGSRLVTASWDKTARVWSPADGSAVATLDAKDGVYAAAISPDGSRVATSGSAILVWDAAKAERVRSIAVEGAQPRRLEFSSDGSLLVSGWSDGAARVHSVPDGVLVATLAGGRSLVETVAFLPGDARVATGDTAGVVRLFPARGGAAEWEIDTGGRAVNHLACSADRIAVGTDQLWLIDPARGGIVLGLTPHEDAIWHLSWSRDGRRLATCTSTGALKVLGRPTRGVALSP